MRNVKKQMRWVIMLFVAAAVSFGLSSCKKSDSDKAPTPAAKAEAKPAAPASQSQPADKAECKHADAAAPKAAAPAATPKAVDTPAQPTAAASCDKAAPASCADKADAKAGQASPAGQTAEVKPAGPSAGLIPIPLVLPRAMFSGTPANITGVPNLIKPLGKAREPFLAPPGTINVALNKPVTSSDENPIIGEIAYVTDGDKEASEQSCVELGPMLQWVQIDLGAPHTINAVVVWHFHRQVRVYFDVVVQAANDPDFISGVTTIFNNDHDNTAGLGVGTDMNYVETNEGKLIDAKGVQGRYVRLYSRGNNADDMNNYIEVEVYGQPIK